MDEAAATAEEGRRGGDGEEGREVEGEKGEGVAAVKPI